jgi:hypothetical protein
MQNKIKNWSMLAALGFSMMTGLTACNKKKPIVTISQITWGFVSAETGSLSQNVTLYPYTTYKLRYNFSLSVDSNLSSNVKLQMVAEYGNVAVVSGSIDEGNGTLTELSFTDANGNQNRKATMSVTLPKVANQSVSSYIAINYEAKTFGTTTTSLNFTGAEGCELSGQGQDGITKGLQVNKIKLNEPSASYNNSTKVLQWRHVGGATSYKISLDGTFANDISNNQVIVNVPSEAQAGDPISYDMSEIPALADHQAHLARVKAYSTNVNYDESDFSEAVSVQIVEA